MSIILPYKDTIPKISEDVWLAPNSAIIGDVEIGAGSGIWFNCTVRGDVANIRIGARTNIQDGSVIHVTKGGLNTYIGNNVTIGHMSLIHACTIEDLGFVGMGSVILDEAYIETNGMLAAGSLLTGGKRIKSGELWSGRPAKFWRHLRQEEIDFFLISADNYAKHAQEYRELYRKN